jgi:hypothetical protein
VSDEMKFFHRNKEDHFESKFIPIDSGMNYDKPYIMKALVALAIDKTLLSIGKPVLDKVTNELYKKYQCYLPDCYDHPEYLEDILKSVFGSSYHTIVHAITVELQDHMSDKGIEVLIKTIGR